MLNLSGVLTSEHLKIAFGVGAGAVGLVGGGAIAQSVVYERHDKKLRETGVLLKILPKDGGDIKETEKLIKNIHSMLLNTKWRKIKYGRPYMTFEIAAVKGAMNFYMFVPRDMKDRIIDRVYSTYPEVAIEVVENDYVFSNPKAIHGAELRLGYHHTLKIKNKNDKDILSSILAGMKDLDNNEMTAVQIVIRPLDNSWQHKGRKQLEKFEHEGIRPGEKGGRFIDKLGGIIDKGIAEVNSEIRHQGVNLDIGTLGLGGGSNKKSKFDRNEITTATEKLKEPGFETIIRVLALGPYKKGNTARVKAISAAFNELDSENRFKKDTVYSHNNLFLAFKERKAYLYGKDNILTPGELRNFLFRLPDRDLMEKMPEIQKIIIKQFAPPSESVVKNNKRSGVILAKNTYRGTDSVIEIKNKDFVRHVVVQGKTGSGKSEFVKTPFLDHISNIRDEKGNIIKKGRGAMLLEPHGKLADEILEIIPEDRRKDVVLFDLFSEYPLGFNFCKVPDRESDNLTYDQMVQKTRDEAIEIFKRTFSDVWSEKNEFYIKNAIKAVIETDHTMVELPRLFSDKKFRNRVVKQIKDVKVKNFFKEKFKENKQGKIDSSTQSTVESVEYKLEKFLDSEELVRALGQKECIDFKDILDNDKIIIFRFSKDRMSKDRINFIGGIAIKLLIVAAYVRDKSKWDDPFMVVIDEAQNFINETIKDILYELRKYGIALFLMHQELNQMNEVPGLLSAIYNNVGTSITFTVGDMDAPFFVNKYGPRVDKDDLENLASRYGYCKLLVNGKTSDTFNIYSLDRPEVPADIARRSVEEILEYNKKGRLHIDEIDKMIRARFDEDPAGEDYEEVGFAMQVSDTISNDPAEDNKKSIWG